MTPALTQRPRIGIGGIAIESCTFSPLPSTVDDFVVGRGAVEMQTMYPYLPNWTYRHRQDVVLVPCYKARALAGGQVAPTDYEQMKRELLDRVRDALPLDGFFFDVHGAMSVEGMDDAEADLVEAIREIVGQECVISAGMDLHGNVSKRLVSQIDIFTCYREAPHIDELQTKERAVGLLIDCLDSGIRPYRAWVSIPVILPGECTSTFVEPGKTVYGKLKESDGLDGVIDPSLWVGYVWADERRTSATVVVTGTDPEVIRGEAERIARRYWDARLDFKFEVPTGDADWAINQALNLNQKSVFITDSGDNLTAGGAGDIPSMVERLLARQEVVSKKKTAIIAGIVGTEAVQRCVKSGIGSEVKVSIGGVLDPVNGERMTLEGVVHSIQHEDPVGGDIAVVKCGGLSTVITSWRKVFFCRDDFDAIDLNVDEHDLIVVKVGYLFPDQRQMATSTFMALTPGAVNQDISSLIYKHVQRPMFPLDPDMEDLELPVTIFPPIIGQA